MQIERPKVVEFKNDRVRKSEKQNEMISRSELARRWGMSAVSIKRYTERDFDPLPMEKTSPTGEGKKEIVRIPLELAIEWKARNTNKNYQEA